MPLIATLLIHLAFYLFLSLCLQFVYISLIRLKPTEVRLFYGKTPLRFRIGGTMVVLGWIPIGTAISYDPDQFLRKPWAARFLGHLSPAAIGFATATVLLGPAPAWQHFVSGFRQILEGAWEPVAKATGYLSHWHQAAEASPAAGLGILAAKAAAFSLLPIGGSVIVQLLADAGRATRRDWLERAAVFEAVALMIIVALWGFAALWITFAG